MLYVDLLFSGIMTLTRTPCELDKMSLFQDLKLKRRKVDSRCSSDGKQTQCSFFCYCNIICLSIANYYYECYYMKTLLGYLTKIDK